MRAKRFFRGYAGLFSGLVIAGGLAVGWGASIHGKTGSNIMIAVGGALLGTATAGLAGSLSESDFLVEIRRLLTASLAPGLVTDERLLRDHRRKYHHYVMSRVGRERVWTHSVLDFSTSYTAGKLTSVTEVGDGRGNVVRYRVEAGFVDQRCIMAEKAQEGTEPAAIYLYPSFSQGYRGVHAGIAVLESWDGTPAIVPTLISREEVVVWDEVGVIDRTTAQGLTPKWREHCEGLDELVAELGVESRASG
jgi:hypothetical protein